MQKRGSHESTLTTQASLSLYLPKKNTKNTNSTRYVKTTVREKTTNVVWPYAMYGSLQNSETSIKLDF